MLGFIKKENAMNTLKKTAILASSFLFAISLTACDQVDEAKKSASEMATQAIDEAKKSASDMATQAIDSAKQAAGIETGESKETNGANKNEDGEPSDE
jgi:vacuolar-type H+-ATPase subunit H